MSIRKKLLLSYIAMVVVPIIVFALTAVILVTLFLNDALGIKPLSRIIGDFENVKEFREAMDRKTEWTSGLAFFARHEPDRLEDAAFLEKTEKELDPLDIRLIIVAGDKVRYISPAIEDSSAAALPRLGEFDSSGAGGYHSDTFKLDGIDYTVLKYAFTLGDGSPGVLYILEEDRLADLARLFFVIVLLFVILIVGLTNGLLTYLVSRGILRPLDALKHAAEQIKEGNLDNELKVIRKDEIGQLSATFEEMRKRLRASIHTQLQAEENRKELLSNISHDLKTPITAISACAEGMRDGIADTPQKQAKYIEMIHSKAAHLDRLIDELFLYSKLDLRRLPFHFEQTDINAYLHAFADELHMHPQYSGIRIMYDHTQGKPVMAVVDREKLGRVIANITDNSLKHMDKKEKEIRIELFENKQLQEITVSIKDNGRGIEAAGLPHIFDRFYRTDLSRNNDTGGSGLGLAIVKQIVEEHGGRVWAESVPGESTTILFTLTTPKGYKGEHDEKDLDHRG
ncbi:sensor histidine kinase [Paenibacillus sepulcri]|uniref:histidine kinase n=1 Tax=Paenibacillus sepulcri TaxID=359917 RepID=A0ABS7C8F2_9BACL|nr:HAMP domain-containing histidine kinase [Paenibacillus sepulcri]